jgi:hypothetical protein
MAFSFLLMLLTPTGSELCSNFFQENDDVDGYNWDEAPDMDLQHIYQLPILNHKPELTQNLDSDSDLVQRDGHGSDSKEDELDLDDESKPGKIMKKQTNKGPVEMKCSRKQLVTLLDNLLVFHAMYKCGPPLFGPESLPSNADELLLVVCKLVAQIISYCPHKERHKWKLQKLHEVLHFPLMIFFFCHAENIDAGMGEHHLKDVFKDVACNSEQRGQDTFLSQCATRMHEKLIMTKAKHYSEAEALCTELPTDINWHDQPTSANDNIVCHTLPQGLLYTITHHNTTNMTDANGQVIGSCTVKLKGMNTSTEIHPAILFWLENNWEIEIGNHRTTMDCYTEMKMSMRALCIMLIQTTVMVGHGRIGLWYPLVPTQLDRLNSW